MQYLSRGNPSESEPSFPKAPIKIQLKKASNSMISNVILVRFALPLYDDD